MARLASRPGLSRSATLVCALVLVLGSSAATAACESSSDVGSDGGAPPVATADAASTDDASSAEDAALDATADTNASRSLRVSSETRGVTRGTDRAFGTELAQRCPESSLLVGLEVVEANDPTLLCAQVAPDGSLGAEVRISSGSGVSGEPTMLHCPAGEVAVRLTGAYDDRVFTGIGLRCQKPLELVDGGRVGAGNPSTPASFGASSPTPFDDPCPNGSALSGLAYFAYAGFGTGNPAGFGTATPLCRRLVKDKSPSGIVLEVSRPFGLGPMTKAAPVKLVSSANTPTTPPTSTLDCPDGSVVTGIDGGSSFRSGPTTIAEVQLVCRPLDPAALLGAESAKGRGVSNALVARCLEGQGVRSLAFTVRTTNLGAISIDTPEFGSPTCALPDAVDVAEPELALPAVFPQGRAIKDLTFTLKVACPAGSLLTGVDQWITPNDDGTPSSLHHLAPHCRAVTR